MWSKDLGHAIVLVSLVVCLGGCNGTPAPVLPSASPCPPIAGPITARVSDADVSSVTVPDGATGTYDDASLGHWCSPGDLKIAKVDVNSLILQNGCFESRNVNTPPCPPYNALAAIDVRPSGVGFASPPQPDIYYDLSVPDNQPQCTKEGTNCGGYEIYQLIEPTPTAGVAWRPVGQALGTTYEGKPAAQGAINHFSTFALVELPKPQPVQPPLQARMIVRSDFLPDDQEGIRVAFEIVDSNLLETGQTRLFRFSEVDPALTDAGLPEDCLKLATANGLVELAGELTCFFPTGMTVDVELGVGGVDNRINIKSIDRGYVGELYAQVEVY